MKYINKTTVVSVVAGLAAFGALMYVAKMSSVAAIRDTATKISG